MEPGTFLILEYCGNYLAKLWVYWQPITCKGEQNHLPKRRVYKYASTTGQCCSKWLIYTEASLEPETISLHTLEVSVVKGRKIRIELI